MKNKKLKKKIIRDFKAGKYREVKGKEKYQEIASHTKDSWLEDEQMYLENEFEEGKSLAARNDRLKKKKLLTSITLDEDTILKLKAIAEKRGIPYQVLMLSYILKGLKEDEALNADKPNSKV